MTYKPGFDIDLRYGEAREDAFVHVLLRSKVEVKSDRKARETGNVAVEYEQVGTDGQARPSGIATTEADWYAVEYDAGRWQLIETAQLKELARRAIRANRHKWIGDNDEHHNALVPLQWFVAPLEPVEQQEVAA